MRRCYISGPLSVIEAGSQGTIAYLEQDLSISPTQLKKVPQSRDAFIGVHDEGGWC